MVRRILSVREQLSKEWVEDLELLIQLNDDILDTFEEYTVEENNKEDDDDIDDDDDEKNSATVVTNQDQNDDDDDEDDSSVSFLHSDLDLLEKALDAPDAEKETISDPSSSSTSSSSGSNTGSIVSFDRMSNTLNEEDRHRYNNNNSTIIFDRNVVWSWTQSLWSSKRNSSPSSPYRKSNFDLLLLLSTQESVHRVLNSYRDSSSSNKNDGEDDAVRPETFEWLLEFYKDNVMEYFDGHQTYARSEDFLEKMLTSPRTLIETKSMNDDDDAWVDPARIAEGECTYLYIHAAV